MSHVFGHADLLAGIRVVLFDAVGTLIHPDPPAAQVYHVTGRRYGSRLAVDTIQERFLTAYRTEEVYDRAHGWATCESREEARWRRIVTQVFTDLEVAETCFRELFDHFARPNAWRVQPGTDELLNTLKARDIAIGLASNYDCRLRSVVNGLTAMRSVDQVIISSEVGWRKPAAQFFQAAADRMAVPPGEILFVGDDLENDYEGARAMGLRAVLLRGHAAGQDSRAQAPFSTPAIDPARPVITSLPELLGR